MSSFIDHRGDGSNKSFLIPFEYYENDQLFAYVDDKLVEIEQYNKNSIVLKDIPPSGSLVRIRRIVDVDTPFATYVTGSDLTEDTLNKNNLKLLYGIQQLNDGFIDDDFYFKQDISMGNNRIIDVADGVDDTDAVNYSQVKNLDTNVKQIEQNIIRLEQQAKASKDAAGVSETNAKVSETNAKTSEINSKTSETNAKESELLAKQYADAAKISETNAKDSELLAKQYEDAAKVSETNSKTSETNSKTSETNAKESELLAKASKDAAGISENNAKQYADAAKVSETNSKTSETNAKDSELLAKQYAAESKSTKPDYKTIFIDTASNIAAKDIAINEDKDDLASKRGQIGKCYNLTSSIDFNTLFKAGRYWINNARFDGSSNKPPATAGGFCDVLGEESGSNYTKQIYHEYNKPVIYIREHKGTTEGWNETWTRIITEKNLATTFAPGIVQLNNTTSSTSTSQAATAKAVKLAYDKASEALTKTGLPLGHIYLWPFSTPPDGSIQVNGSEYNRELYSDLWSLIQEKGWYKPESEWQQIASANGGYCPWYSDGDGSTTFRTPKFAPYQKLALASSDAGKYYEAGLPNIEGSFGTGYLDNINMPTSGAFSKKSTTNAIRISGTDVSSGVGTYTFDASKVNPIYGNSDTVQPESHDWIVCVVAFGTATNVGSVDVANVMSAVSQVQATALLKSGGTLTGAVVEKLAPLSGNSVSLDLKTSNNFTHTATANTTFTVTANTGTSFQLGTLVLTNAGNYTITWPSSFKWADNTPPTLNTSGIDVITFFTIDGGTKYYAVQSITGVA